METGTEKKTNRALLTVLSLVLVVGVAASCTLGALALQHISQQDARMQELTDKLGTVVGSNSDTVTQEDDVAVAGEYYIRSTLPISDAYKSGDTSALSAKQLETLNMAKKVLDEIITEGMTPYEKEKAVYDWMCANLGHEGGVTVVVPTASEYSAEPYGVLKYGTAVCVGYATTFRMFMQMMDIDCKVVHNSYHSWDLVNLDGDWYHTDIYSDAGSGNYANFNMTDDMASHGHDWDRDFFPAANGLKYCYAYKSAEELDDVYKLPANVRAMLDSGETHNLYYLISDDLYTQQLASAILGDISTALTSYGEQTGRDMWMDNNMQIVDGRVLLTVNVTEYGADDGGEDNGLKPEDTERIGKAVQDAFGDVYSVSTDDSGDMGGDGAIDTGVVFE